MTCDSDSFECYLCDVTRPAKDKDRPHLELTPFGWFLYFGTEDDGTSDMAVRYCPWCGRYLDPTLMPAPDDSSTLHVEEESDADADKEGGRSENNVPM